MGLCDFSLPATPGLQMGPQAIQFIRQFPLPIPDNCCVRFVYDYRPNSKRNSGRCFSSGRSGGSRWDWEKNVNPKQKSRLSGAYATDDFDEEVEFGYRNAAKQRIWWYDDFDEEDDEDDNDGDGVGILEPSVGFEWAVKVFQAFGWMIPAVVISLLMGTGPNTIMMALVLPLAQSAFSLATDTLFGRPNESPRPKSKRKKRPFAGAGRCATVRKEKQMRTNRVKEARNYKSWMDANNFSVKNRKNNPQNFGGWDELDNQVQVEKEPCVGNANEARTQEGITASRRTKGDAPLFMKLLTTMFPFLGFWNKLL